MQPGAVPQAFVTEYDDAPAFWMRGVLWNVLISGDQSFGQFTLLDQTMPEGAGPGLHIHERMSEGFYVIEGQLTYTIGEDRRQLVANPGGTAWIPPGTPHAFTVTGGPARALNFYTPGGFDDRLFYQADPAEAKTMPPADWHPSSTGRDAEFLARIRNLHEETPIINRPI